MDRPHPNIVDLINNRSVKSATPAGSRPGLFQRLRSKQDAVPEESKDAVFDQNKFTVETGTGNSEKLRFNENLQTEYSTFLDNHLTRLANEFNLDPNSPIFKSPEFRHQKMLLDSMAEKSMDGTYKINKQKIEKALKIDPELWITTTQIMEENIALTLAGLGLTAEVNPGFNKSSNNVFNTTVDAQRIYMNVNRGWLNRLTGDHPILATLGVIGAGAASTPQGIGWAQQAYAWAVENVPQFDTFVNNAIGMAQNPAQLAATALPYAGAVAAGTAWLVGKDSLFQRGLTIDIEKNAKLLRRLKSGSQPAEVQYLQKVIGLSVNDFSPTLLMGGVKRVDANPESLDPSKIQEAVLSQILTRFEFYTAGLGIPAEKVNVVPDNLTYSNTRSNTRGELTTWGMEMQDVRNRKTAEFINRTDTDPNSEEQSLIDLEARRETITRRLEKVIVKQEASAKTVTELSDLESALKKEEGKGRIINNRTEDLTKTEAALTAVNIGLSGEHAKATAYTEALTKLEKARSDAQKEFGVSTVAELQNLTRERDVLPDARLETLRDELLQAEMAVENLKVSSQSIDRLHLSQEGQFTTLSSIDARLLAAASPPTAVNIDLNVLANSTVEEIFTKINTANSRLGTEGWPKNENSAHMKEVYQAIAEARARQIDPNVAVNSPDLAAWGVGGVGGIGNHDLMNLTVDQIIEQVNNTIRPGTLNPNLPADRDRVKNVKNEARRKYDVRYQAWREVVAEESDIRTRHNASENERNGKLESEIEKLKTERTAMTTEEAAVAAFKDTQKIANKYLDTVYPDYHRAFEMFENYHIILSTARVTTLDPDSLHAQTVAQILDAVNLANAAHPTVGWDATQNNNPQFIRWIIAARTESIARASHADMRVDVPGLAAIRAIGVPEEMAIVSKDGVKKLQTDLRRAGLQPAITIAQLEEAAQQATRRHGTRKQVLAGNIRDAIEIGAAGRHEFDTSDEVFLQLDTEFQAASKAFVQRKAKLAAPGGVADLNTEITRLEGERNALQEYPDLSDYLKNIQDELYKKYTEAATSLDTKRAEVASKANGAVTSEQLQRKIEDRTKFTKADVEAAITTIKTAQEGIDPAKTTVEEAMKVRKDTESAYKDIKSVDNALRRATPPLAVVGLTMTDLINTDFDVLLTRMNTAHERSVGAGVTPPIGWPKEENEIPEIREKLANAVAGARMDQAQHSLLRPAPNAAEILKNISIDQALSMSASDLATASLAWRTAPGIAPAAMTPAEISDAQKVLINITKAQRETIQDTIDSNNKRKQKISSEIKKVEESYKEKQDFVSVVKVMTQKQGEIYSRIPSLIGEAQGADFTVSVPAASNEFTEAEKIPTIAGAVVPNLPKGYFDVLNMLTGYQDNTKDGRDVLFKKFINIPQLQPDAIATQLDRHLQFGFAAAGRVPITIDVVMTEIKRRVDNKTLNQSDLFYAVREMRDNYIAEVKAIS